MNGSGALDFQGRGEKRQSPGVRWVLPVCACRCEGECSTQLMEEQLLCLGKEADDRDLYF